MTSSRGTRSAFLSVRPCGRDLFELIPKGKVRIDLRKASDALRRSGYEILEVSEMAITAKGKHDLSLFPNGKMIVHPVRSNEDAEELGKRIMAILASEEDCAEER